MAELRSCPWRDELQQMVLGKLNRSRAEAIAQHLDTCPTCLDALREWVISDEILEAVQAGRAANSEPTKTMYLPIGRIRDAVSTWLVAHDDTRTDHEALPPSLADFKTVLSPPQSADEIGRIADFRVLRLLGIGGMAAVFEAEDTRLKRRVALKLLHPGTASKPGANERFLRESQSAAALKHEHVVTIHQVGLHEGTPFLVLELLHGETLEDHLARTGRLNVPEIIRIGREIAEGLAAAHAGGLLHRDIKPANIWLEGPESSNPAKSASRDDGHVESVAPPVESNRLPHSEPASGRVKILDFGLAKSWSAEPEISHAGMMIGTPRYMAPEQVAGDALDPRTDLFSLGCVLYRMATGRAPFGGSDLLSVLRALACEEPPPVRTLNPQVPAALSDLISQLISKSADQRPSSAQEVVHRLQAIADDLAAGRGFVAPANGLMEREPQGHRGRVFTWFAAIALMILLPLGYLFGAQLIRIATNKGQVVIQIDDPEVAVTIQENRVAIQDRPGQREITLKAGEHQLEVTVKESTGEKTFTTDKFMLRRGGRKVIEVREELSKALSARPAVPPTPLVSRTGGPTEEVHPERLSAGTDRYRRVAQWVLSLGGSVTVQVPNQPQPTEVPAGTALPAADFELTQINLNARPVTDAGLDELTGLKNLNELVLSKTQITDAGVAHLQGLTGLKHLLLNETQVTDAGLTNLRGLKNLNLLMLNWSKVADSGLVHLESLTELRALYLRGTQATDTGLKHLQPLIKLETLNLSRLPVTDSGFAQLHGLTQLRWLDLESTRVTDAGLTNLRTLKDLQYLDLNGTAVTDSGLVHLEGLTELRSLHLRRTHVTDAGLKHLGTLTKLETLNLSGLPVTDNGLRNLRTLKDLRHLSLDRTAVTDAGLVHLEPLTKLESVNLGETQVTAAGLEHLQGLNNLGGLSLKGAREVGDFAIPKLLHLNRLQMIDLSDTHVSAQGLAILKASFPSGAQIVWSELNDTAVRAVLAAGGRVDVCVRGAVEDHPVKAAREIPSESFQIKRVSLAGVRLPLKEVLDALKKPGVDALSSLDLSDTAIVDADLASLKGLIHLRRLVLDGAYIEGQGLIHLQELPELRDLRLGCPKLVEFFLVELAGLKKLEKLSLAKSHVSDEGARQLAQLKHLKELDLTETKVTAAGVHELQKSLPTCRILTSAAR
ncbi:MAG TPA: protein kinase [Planctomycetaceae bacterium]|jgi:serine/threonine protein kinase/Leucine-rich repeat (LRR) protein|nr:protein kinase [Planctomycetaceae bacterium]